jgi:hypothetical protein
LNDQAERSPCRQSGEGPNPGQEGVADIEVRRIGGTRVWFCTLVFIQQLHQYLAIIGNFKTIEMPEPVSCCHLVIVSVLTEIRPPWQHHYGLAYLQCRNDGAHARMGDHDVTLLELGTKQVGLYGPRPFQVFGDILRLTNLGKNLFVWVARSPLIKRADEPFKRQLCSDGCENHFKFSR